MAEMGIGTAHLVSGSLGTLIGAALTLALVNLAWETPPASKGTQAESAGAAAETTIASDPSVCGKRDLELPTAEEAQAAFRKAKGEAFPNVSITLGRCDKDVMGPGVACMSRIVWGPGGEPVNRLVGFAKSPDGWAATLY